MIVLGIETSCDDTSASVLQDETTILSNIISSQTEYHKKYGGVVPEIASRKHQEHIIPVVTEALEKAGKTIDDIQGVAVTQGPGLVGSLLTGINVAKAIAYARKLPLVGVNHLEGHLLAPHLEHEVPYPNVTLVVSGGHTNIYLVKQHGSYELLGKTRDDAAGEAFDKVAKLLDLGYPGGVVIDRLATDERCNAIAFPRPMLNDDTYDFSFSGLKTAVLYHVKNAGGELDDDMIADVVSSFQAAVVEILVKKTLDAALEHKVPAITIGGGVAANSMLRARIEEAAGKHGIPVSRPSMILCTDNAAMIAYAGLKKLLADTDFPYSMNAISRWPL